MNKKIILYIFSLCLVSNIEIVQSAQARTKSKLKLSETICQICGKKIAYSCNIKRHYKTHEDISYPCGICKKEFTSKIGLKDHKFRLHVIRRKYECNICDKKYSVKGDLSKHQKSPGHENNLKKLTDQSSPRSYKAKADIELPTPFNIEEEDDFQYNTDDESIKQESLELSPSYACTFCQDKFENEDDFFDHIYCEHFLN